MRFPFGKPVEPCLPSANSPKNCFILGAYPSAFHIQWRPPVPYQPVQALAVDNEPEPFWNGDDQELRIISWKEAVNWQDGWGTAEPAGNLNGSSGIKLEERYLGPLHLERPEAWITDCLDTYRLSVGGAARISDTYDGFSAEHNLPAADLLPHPSEAEVVRQALREHNLRLQAELSRCRPELIITLGNSALSVIQQFVTPRAAAQLPRKLSIEEYGDTFDVLHEGRRCKLLPLAHPAAPAAYQHAHDHWISSL